MIPITKIISIENPKNYKLHAARWTGEDEPLDCYVTNKDDWLYWNKWRGKKDDFNRQYIFSLMDFYPETNMWLFGGIYKVIGKANTNNDFNYEIEELNEYADYVGRLKIKIDPKVTRGRAFLLETYLEKMEVSEILREPYSGAVFPGYENINHDFNILEPIFKNELIDWKTALENVKGVYVIMDKSNGKKYIGSAYGDAGIWSRWQCYLTGEGHGGNIELVKLIKKEGRERANKDFRLSLLEYRPMKADDSVIIERENYWKEVFLSRGKFGYNKN